MVYKVHRIAYIGLSGGNSSNISSVPIFSGRHLLFYHFHLFYPFRSNFSTVSDDYGTN